MANVIKIKRGSGTPTTSNLAEYQLGYDYTNNKLYIHDPTNSSGQEIVEVGGSGASTSGSNNQVLTDDGSGGMTSEGNLTFDGAALNLLTTTANRRIEIGLGATQDVTSFVDLIGDTTYSDYGGRFIRYGGANAITQIMHRGTGSLRLLTQDSAPIDFLTASAVRARISASGNMTIGSDTPYTTGGTPKLSLVGGGLNLGANANDLSYIRRIATGEYQWQTWNGSNDGEIHLQPYGGLVGIGTTSPSAKLHVDGSAIFDTDTGNQPFYITRIGTLGQALKMYVDDNSAVIESVQDETSGTYGNLVFIADSGSTGAVMDFKHGTATKMRLEAHSGNLGIGTLSPGYKLDVSGNSRFTSDLRNEGRLLNSVGSSGSPSYSFYSQGNAGMFRSGDGVGFSAGGSSVYDINSTRMYINTNVGIGTSSPEDLLHVHSTGDTNLRIKSTANKAQIRYQNDTQSWFTGIASDESYFWYGTQIAGNAGFIQSSTGNLYWEKNVILSVNAKYLYSRDTSGALTRMFGMNGSNTTYIGPIDSYAGGRMYYGASANMSGHNFYTGGTLRMKLDGYVLDLPNTGDWSSILNNTNSGGLRFGTKDAGGTLAYQIELSNTGNYVKLNEPTQIIKETSTTASATGTTLFTLTNDVGADLNQQKTFVDFTLLDDNANETPQVRIGAEVGQNGDANSQEKEGSGAFVVYTNNADTTSGDAGASLAERMRVDYQGNVGIGVTSPSFSWGTRGIEIQGSGVNPVLRLDRSDSIFEITARSTDILLYNTGTARSLRFGVGASEKFRINSDGNTYVYETLILNANNESLLQRDTGGTVRNLIKLDSSNRVLIGDANTAGVHHHYPSTYSQINTDHGYLQIGAQNTSHCHYTTDRSNHWFNQMIYVNGGVVSSYLSDLSLRRNGANSDSILIQDNTVKVYTDSTDERFRFGSLNRSFVNQAFGPINNNSKAYIRANDGYSTSTTPDYTWWYNDQCGIYHPAGNTIGFSASGQKVLISTYGLYSADDIYINHGGSGYSPGLQFMGGSNTPGANEYENAKLAYHDNSGTGLFRFTIGRGAGNYDWYIGGNRVGLLTTDYFQVPDNKQLAAGNDNDIFIKHDGNGHLQSGTGVLYINQTANNVMMLSTNNTERMRINGNGNIGIANTAPYEKLDVKSASSTSPAIVANGAAANGCVNMAHGYGGVNGDYINTYGTQYSSGAMVLGFGVKPSTTANDTFLCSADNSNFTRGALVIDNELRFWQGVAANGTLNNNFSMTERFRLTAGGIGHFDGDVVAYSSTVSDKRLKENITTIDNALDKVMELRGVEYDWTATSRKGTHDIGLIAQEVEEVLPELVTEHELCTGEFGGEGNEKAFKTVNYDKMVGVLIEAIKEQQQQINELKIKLEEKSNG